MFEKKLKLPKKDFNMYNESHSFTSLHKITLDGLICRKNNSNDHLLNAIPLRVKLKSLERFKNGYLL